MLLSFPVTSIIKMHAIVNQRVNIQIKTHSPYFLLYAMARAGLFFFSMKSTVADSWPAFWKHPLTLQHNITNPWLLLAKWDF